MNFEQALESIPATQAAFDSYDWLRPVDNFTKVIDDVRQDNFYTGGKTTMTDALDTLINVNTDIEKTQIFYHNYPEKRELMNTILQSLDVYRQMKTSLDPYTMTNAVVKYNDNLESARAKYYLKYLRKVCQEYNNTNQNIVRIDYYLPSTPGTVLHDRQATKYARGWVNGTFYPIESFQYDRIIKKTRDKIEYDWGIDGLIDSSAWKLNFFDMDKNEMIAELKKRGYQHQTLERPGDTYAGGK